MELLDRFREALQRQDLSPGTVQGYLHDLKLFREWFRETNGEDLSPERLTEIDILSYRGYLQNVRRMKAATINRRLQAIRKFCRWSKKEGLVPGNPAEGVRTLESTKRGIAPGALQRREINGILREAQRTGQVAQRERNYAIIQLLLQTGLRVGEVVELKLGDITFGERSGSVHVRSGKGRKEREVPLNSSARKALQGYLEARPDLGPEDPLFGSQRGEKLTVRGVQHLIRDLTFRAGLTGRGISPHTLRHTFSTHYLRDHEGDVVGLAALLGHENLGTTAIYTRPRLGDLGEKLERTVSQRLLESAPLGLAEARGRAFARGDTYKEFRAFAEGHSGPFTRSVYRLLRKPFDISSKGT